MNFLPNKIGLAVSQRIISLFAIAILVLGIVVVLKADNDYYKERSERAVVRASILAVSVTAAVDFDDREGAFEAVSAFRADPATRIAAVYNSSGKLLSKYSRQGVAVPLNLPVTNSETDISIETIVPVQRDGATIGTVYLSSDTIPFSQRFARLAFIAAFALAASLIIFVLAVSQRSLREALIELKRQMEARHVAEEKLHQAQKMESIGQLTGGIAHDFNNMLAVVIGSIDIARRRISDPDRVLTALNNARAGADRAADLTKRLLAFARKQPLQPQVIEPNQLVAGMSELLRRTLGERIVVETVLAGGLWRVDADPGQLENAILNLSVNARDAMAGEGRLTIETQNSHLDDAYVQKYHSVAPGQYVVIAVTDNGCGMTSEVIKQAFEPFFTTKDVGQGTGLGLSQVEGFIRQSGGHLAIYSEVGVGTTLKIYLPRHQGAHETINAMQVSEIIPHGSRDEIILVVEDEPQVRQISTECLRDLGYTVLEAANGSEALAILADRHDVLLLFTDVVMPGMNGRELVDRARETHPTLPVLYTTGYTRNAIIHNGIVDQGVTFLAKPFTIEQVAQKVRSVLDSDKT